MKGFVKIDVSDNTIEAAFTLTCIDDVGLALAALQNAARTIYPTILFRGEPGFEEDDAPGEASSEAPRKRKAPDFSRPPRPGTTMALVLDMARELGAQDEVAIADRLDLKTGSVVASLRMLRAGGHLPPPG